MGAGSADGVGEGLGTQGDLQQGGTRVVSGSQAGRAGWLRSEAVQLLRRPVLQLPRLECTDAAVGDVQSDGGVRHNKGVLQAAGEGCTGLIC